MNPYKFECRTLEVEHSCSHQEEKEPVHPPQLKACINSVIVATKGMHFNGIIKSPSNNHQIDLDFDSKWIEKMKNNGWRSVLLSKDDEIFEKSNIKPDAILEKDGSTFIFEIEKSNKKTIWFDFIKVLMFIGQNRADFGILIVPKNYAHKLGIWDLFYEARFYRYCLARFAKVDSNLLSKIGIIGYMQEVSIEGNWKNLDSSVFNDIKKKASEHFS